MKQLATILLFVTGFCAQAQPFRTPTFTGVVTTDFLPTERNVPLGTGSSYALTWDANFLYIGLTGPGAYIKDEPTIMYIDSDPFISQSTGTTNGFNYDNRQPQLPFTGNVVMFFKTGYAEFRTSDTIAGVWSDRTEITNQITTGATDIEIRIPWVAFPGGTRPTALSFFFFKENGNSSQSDAFDVRPGITNVSETYGLDINVRPPQLFYSLQSTTSNYYTGVNLFDWINFGANCPPPGNPTTSNITTTSARLNWQHVPTRVQYEVRGRRRGTNQWLSQRVPGAVNSIVVNNLVCNVPYEWHVRSICDTTQDVDIISAFSNLIPFRTAGCTSLQRTSDMSVYPSPVKSGGVLTVKGTDLPVGAVFTISSLSGMVLQTGKLNTMQIVLNNSIREGIYLLEVHGTNLIIRKQIQVIQ